jgi:ApaG domain
LIFLHILVSIYKTDTLLYLFCIIMMVLQSLLITRTVLRSIHRIVTAKQFLSSSISSKKSSPVSVRLYRILLYQLQQLPPHKSILLQPALFSSDYGKVKHYQDPTLNKRDEPVVSHILRTFQQWNNDNSQIQTWFHSLQVTTQQEPLNHQDITLEPEEAHTATCWATRQELQDAIRYAFQHTPPGVAMQGVAIQAVQALTEQVALWACTSTSHNTTHGIRIVATSGYVKDATESELTFYICFYYISLTYTETLLSIRYLGSEVSRGYQPETKYRFVYRIRVEKLPVLNPIADTSASASINISSTVQLLGRTWRIQDHDEQGNPDGHAVVVNASTTGVGTSHTEEQVTW